MTTTPSAYTPAQLDTAEAVFSYLTGQGMSPIAAAGIIGNMKAESGLDPESHAIDSNGYQSSGLVQWNAKSYPDSPSLVTGNASADLAAQLAYLTKDINASPNLETSLNAAQTPSQAAQIWASLFERCAACQGNTAEVAGREQLATGFLAYAMTYGFTSPNWHYSGKFQEAVAAAADVATGSPSAAVSTLSGPTGTGGNPPASSSILAGLGLPNVNWASVGTFLLGSAVFIVGMVTFVSNTKTGRAVESDAGKTAAVAAVA